MATGFEGVSHPRCTTTIVIELDSVTARSKLPALAPLPRSFYERSPRRVARDLLGKILIRSGNGIPLAARIVEVEAYLAENDPAAHSAVGRTPRNSVLFGPPGHAYVYFIYGNHYCLNVSCEPDGKAGGVLIRALEPLAGMSAMARNRGIAMNSFRDHSALTSGPGRLAQAFGVTRVRDNGRDLTSSSSGLWIADDGYRPGRIIVTPRIGITKAAAHRLRYFVANSKFVSGPKLFGFTPGDRVSPKNPRHKGGKHSS